MTTRLTLKAIYLFIAFLIVPAFAGANKDPHDSTASNSIFDRLSQKAVADITIETDLEQLLNNRNTKEYTPAEFTLKEGKLEQNWDIKIRPRGKYRRRVCDFPPLKLKFSKKDLKAKGFSPYNDLKLVTHCLDDKQMSKELVMKEFLTYQLFNELTKNSYRVQLAKLTYVDVNSGEKIKRWGFFIEDTEELAARLGAEECDCMGQPSENFQPGQERIVSTFQHMIGNADWSLDMNRNVKLLKDGKSGKLIAVPYDFDFAGLVNAPYALPKKELGLTSIRERVYLGLAANTVELYSTYNFFKTKKRALMEKVEKFRMLDYEVRADLIQYLESFYELINAEAVSDSLVQPRI